jgi:hypothetical protein
MHVLSPVILGLPPATAVVAPQREGSPRARVKIHRNAAGFNVING